MRTLNRSVALDKTRPKMWSGQFRRRGVTLFFLSFFLHATRMPTTAQIWCVWVYLLQSDSSDHDFDVTSSVLPYDHRCPCVVLQDARVLPHNAHSHNKLGCAIYSIVQTRHFGPFLSTSLLRLRSFLDQDPLFSEVILKLLLWQTCSKTLIHVNIVRQ